jgi:hypothetical protein
MKKLHDASGHGGAIDRLAAFDPCYFAIDGRLSRRLRHDTAGCEAGSPRRA